MRALLALVLCCTALACDPVQSFGIVVAPSPGLTDSTRRSALTFRLTPVADTVRREVADSLRARFGDQRA